MHRRLGRRDMRLPVILMGELMAGMALGLVWPQLTAPPLPVPQTAMTAVTVPVPVVPAPPGPTAVPLATHAPRNPFGAPHGIDATQQAPIVVVPTAPAAPAFVPPASAGEAPGSGGPAPAAPPAPAVPPPPQLSDDDFANLG